MKLIVRKSNNVIKGGIMANIGNDYGWGPGISAKQQCPKCRRLLMPGEICLCGGTSGYGGYVSIYDRYWHPWVQWPRISAKQQCPKCRRLLMSGEICLCGGTSGYGGYVSLYDKYRINKRY